MNADRLLAHYEKIVDAPDAIARLRRFVLDLAVRGKLVEQDPADGTGAQLLTMLKSAGKEEAKGGRGRRLVEAKAIAEGENYMPLPKSWAWARIVDVGRTQTGTSPSSSNPDLFGDFTPFVKPADLDGPNTRYDGPGLSEEGIKHSRVAQKNSVLMVCIGATLGKVNTSDRAICFNQQINSVTPYIDGLHAFFALALKASGFQELAWSKAGTGTLPIISKGKWELLPIPLPPLAEQHRIVTKVDELMALCDRLEAARSTREATRDRLTAASLARLNRPDPAPQTFRAHAAQTLEALAPLTTRPNQIKPLRQTILNLAVRGKLVEQGPKDELASELLAKVTRQKANAGSRRTGRDWSSLAGKDVEQMFPPPTGWEWSRIGDLVERVTVGYVGPMKNEYVDIGIPFLRSQNVRANRFRVDGMTAISPGFHQKIIKSALNPGDVVVVRSGNVGTACVIPASLSEANCSDLVIVKRPMAVLSDYLCFYLNSLASAHISEGSVGVALTHFNTKSVALMPFPLPPLAEQRRIVAKVDELMALCDRLEASLDQSAVTRRRLLDALLHEALNPAAGALEAAE